MKMFNGMPIIISNYIIKKVRCRTHKKRRIDKKWLKRYGYKEVQDSTTVYMTNGSLFMSKKCYDKFSGLIDKKQFDLTRWIRNDI